VAPNPSDTHEQDLPPSGLRVVTVGGGKGGVGKSLVATSLAVYLAQIGRRVLLVDADPTGANLHSALGVQLASRAPRRAPDAPMGEADGARTLEASIAATNVPGLRLLVAPLDASASGGVKAARKLQLLRALRTVSADDIVIDVGPGTSTAACDLFLAGDVSILVTVPEPAAIETTYRFLRAVFLRDLRRSLRAERVQLRALDRILGELPTYPRPSELVEHLSRVDPPLGERAALLLGRMRPRLVVNQTRVRTDLELGAWMAQLAQRRLGVQLDVLGYVEHDDAVWLANRRKRPLLVDGPSSKAGRGLERLARRLIAVFPHRKRELDAEATRPREPNHYERLMVQRGASEEEVRRAHKRQREIWAADGLPVVSLYTDDELAHEHALLDEAYATLLDPHQRRAYDVSVFPDHESHKSAPSPAERASTDAMTAELLVLAAQVARELGPDTEFSGPLLRRVRESRGIDLREVSAKTKIGAAHLGAIEAEDFAALPPLVYVRGFLVELAKFHRLDPSQVARTYLRRARELLELRGG
jgi:flagellar biosynthesis protein FlhG